MFPLQIIPIGCTRIVLQSTFREMLFRAQLRENSLLQVMEPSNKIGVEKFGRLNMEKSSKYFDRNFSYHAENANVFYLTNDILEKKKKYGRG